jgi:ATP-dependent phosphoenolpyruvate carboxykinase
MHRAMTNLMPIFCCFYAMMQPQMAGHPKNIIFLSCDAFGVLPPIGKNWVHH